MKRAFSILLAIMMIASGCFAETNTESYEGQKSVNDLRYIQDTVYESLVENLKDDGYFIENVKAIYISDEYIEELNFNSKSNVYFGYTIEELTKQFKGNRYVFTIDENEKTIAKQWEPYENPFDSVIKNVSIGTGVILICVTVSAVSFGTGASAMCLIFATAAKTGAIAALSGGAIGAATGGILEYIQTGDINKALVSAALKGSEAYKWGAITGALAGGASEAIALKGATMSGLSMNEAAAIQMDSGYPLDVIKSFKSMEQYEICKDAGLNPQMVNGKLSLVRDIDLKFTDELGRTNLERMREGLAALDPATGQAYQLHHIGQEMDSTLAILTEAEHMQGGNNLIWHELSQASQIDRGVFRTTRESFWKSLAEIQGGAV